MKIRANYPGSTIPVCYCLYSLKGALVGKHWDALPKSVKVDLLREVSVE